MFDKVAHIGVSFMITTTLLVILPISITVGITIIIGVFKELYDNKFDWKDMVANVIGISAAILINMI